ncbi:hypothetical protein K443DRAFT_569711 [Laccaria amethystina LaAM-08-1]|uniref:Uncharacterized protein n=1 Tax=Laccaria amethystina LaAM-08-1 TaxID=1095629 RepID=A0A0C9WRP2_9AGAR|nr:hypothetical protein K443DRAFT_569711 [Laccaria amethystina LaAM-08-1]
MKHGFTSVVDNNLEWFYSLVKGLSSEHVVKRFLPKNCHLLRVIKFSESTTSKYPKNIVVHATPTDSSHTSYLPLRGIVTPEAHVPVD